MVLFLAVLIFSCSQKKDDKKEQLKEKENSFTIPVGFPEIKYPDDNKYQPEKAAFGKKIFFDKSLSLDSSISCASCHQPQFAFADNKKISPGIKNRLGNRNAPSLLNMAYMPYFMMEGGVPTLEIQVVHPLTDTNEMGMGINEVVERLSMNDEYQKLSMKLFNRKFDAYVLTRVISNYERTLITTNSGYDDYMYNDSKKNSMTVEALNGMNLFFSERTNCSGCHSGIFFTDYTFQNNGLKANFDLDQGRKRITGKEEDEGKFKVPSLRNLKYTAPYMHDGSINTLDEVIEHYDRGGNNHPNKSEIIIPLHLSEKEKNELKAFLLSLSGEMEFK